MIEAIPNNPREKQQNSGKNKRTAPSVYNVWPILNNISTIYVLTPPGAPVKVPVSLELHNNYIPNILVNTLIIFKNNWGRNTIYDICDKLNEPSKSIQPIQNYTPQISFWLRPARQPRCPPKSTILQSNFNLNSLYIFRNNYGRIILPYLRYPKRTSKLNILPEIPQNALEVRVIAQGYLPSPGKYVHVQIPWDNSCALRRILCKLQYSGL